MAAIGSLCAKVFVKRCCRDGISECFEENV
jgi:hypothetical protein